MRPFLTLAFALSPLPFVAANELRQIPLNEVWAYQMPRTKDVRKLDIDINRSTVASPQELIEKSLVEGILASLQHRERPHKDGFVVSGVDSRALKAAYNVLVCKQRPQTKATGSISLVFYAIAGPKVDLCAVEHNQNVITIKWHFVSYSTPIERSTFGLIPIHGLRPGEYEVRLERQPSKSDGFAQPVEGTTADNMTDKFLCEPFRFKIL